MKTIEIKVFEFAELSDEAKESAIKNFRNEENVFTDHIWDEAHATVKAFHNVFGTMEGHNSWLDFRISDNMDSDILELKGLRLRNYIINNYPELWKPKFIGSLKTNEIVKHKRIKSKKLSNGNVFNPYYSGCQIDNSCVLTGMGYDMDLLDPIYDFIAWKKPDYDSYTVFESLMTDCFQSLEKAIEKEIEYRNSDEAIIEDMEANNYGFTEEGEIYN